MKPNLLLCFALVLSGGLFGCSTTPRNPITIQNRAELYTQSFKIDAGQFEHLENEGFFHSVTMKGSVSTFSYFDGQNMRAFLVRNGISLDSSGEAISFNGRISVLWVRTTLSKLQKIESILSSPVVNL